MGATEQSNNDQTILPLSRAAETLGITPDALRMRIKRGKAEGFKRRGRVFVHLREQPNKKPNTGGFEDATPEPAGEIEFAGIVELQRVELNRLLRENERLGRRVEHLMQMQEQEQILRLRMQQTIDRVTRRLEPAGAREAADGGTMVEARLARAEAAVERLKGALERLVALIERGREETGA